MMTRRAKTLKKSSFFGWCKIIQKYLKVKEFIIHKMCVKKMTAKLQVFRVL